MSVFVCVGGALHIHAHLYEENEFLSDKIRDMKIPNIVEETIKQLTFFE